MNDAIVHKRETIRHQLILVFFRSEMPPAAAAAASAGAGAVTAVAAHLVRVRRHAGHALHPEVERRQGVARLGHEADEEAPQTRVHVQGQAVAHGQLGGRRKNRRGKCECAER